MSTREDTLPAVARSPHASGSARTPSTHRGRLWAWTPALILLALLGTQMAVLTSVLADPTFSTEPDYYRKAVDWDTHMARTRQSQALGWSARARVEADGASPSLSVTLETSGGEPVSGARVRASAFHNARASRRLALELDETAKGEYRTHFGAQPPGLWELRLEASRGADAYQATLRLEVMTEGSSW